MPADKSPSQPTAEDTPATGETATGAADDDAAEEPTNRAERRAKKKAGGKPQVVAKVQPRNVNTGPSPRQWANRRSG